MKEVYKQLSCFYRDYSPNEWYWLVSYSGGKGSTTLLLLTLKLAEEKGFELGVVYNDGGGDIPELRGLVRRVLAYVEELGHRIYMINLRCLSSTTCLQSTLHLDGTLGGVVSG
jgi:3'-phosphoadenosine 5'-phosphosulfate sulfotransferase (PAPS reductase)/FAD synthetase